MLFLKSSRNPSHYFSLVVATDAGEKAQFVSLSLVRRGIPAVNILTSGDRILLRLSRKRWRVLCSRWTRMKTYRYNGWTSVRRDSSTTPLKSQCNTIVCVCMSNEKIVMKGFFIACVSGNEKKPHFNVYLRRETTRSFLHSICF